MMRTLYPATKRPVDPRGLTHRALFLLGLLGGAPGVLAIACDQSSPDAASTENDEVTGAATATFQNGVHPSSAYEGESDAMILSSAPTTSDGAATSVRADGDYPDTTGKLAETLLRFDLRSIPAGSTVTSVTLRVDVSNPTVNPGYGIYALRRSWSEATATWNSAASGSAWASPGARAASDRDATSLGTLAPTAAGSYALTLNAHGVATVQQWVVDPSSNHGFVLDTTANKDGVVFASAQNAAAADRPSLSVSYTTGAPPAGGSAGAAGTGGGGGTAGENTPWLPIDISDAQYAAMKASAKKVYPIGVITFSPTTALASYLPPGTSSPNPANGGSIRDNYPVVSSDLVTARTAELNWYKAAGFDSYIMDYFSASYATQMTALAKAAIATGTTIILQPDGTTSATKGGASSAASIALGYLKAYPAAYAKDASGKYLVAPFKPEAYPASWWQDFASAMSAAGFPVDIIGIFESAPTSANQYKNVFSGAGWWGDTNPRNTLNSSTAYAGWTSFCHDNGLKAYQFVSSQGDRPRENDTTDPHGFDLLTKTAQLAESSDNIILPTSNDFTEGAQITRSVGSGYGWLDLLAYYTAKFKLGASAVPIVRDGLYVIHRKQFASWEGTQPTKLPDAAYTNKVGGWKGTIEDQVSCLAFLTAPASVTCNGVTTANVPAGVTQLKAPLTLGTISASVTRGSSKEISVTSPHVVANAGVSTKLNYVTSSFPGRAGQALDF